MTSTIAVLLTGLALLLIGVGLLGTLLGVRATLASFSYASLGLLEYLHLIEPVVIFPLERGGGQWALLRFAFHIAAFYAVAVLASYFADELRRADSKLAKARDEILDLEHIKGSILRSMGGGLIAFNENEQIIFKNTISFPVYINLKSICVQLLYGYLMQVNLIGEVSLTPQPINRRRLERVFNV